MFNLRFVGKQLLMRPARSVCVRERVLICPNGTVGRTLFWNISEGYVTVLAMLRDYSTLQNCSTFDMILSLC